MLGGCLTHWVYSPFLSSLRTSRSLSLSLGFLVILVSTVLSIASCKKHPCNFRCSLLSGCSFPRCNHKKYYFLISFNIYLNKRNIFGRNRYHAIIQTTLLFWADIERQVKSGHDGNIPVMEFSVFLSKAILLLEITFIHSLQATCLTLLFGRGNIKYCFSSLFKDTDFALFPLMSGLTRSSIFMFRH